MLQRFFPFSLSIVFTYSHTLIWINQERVIRRFSQIKKEKSALICEIRENFLVHSTKISLIRDSYVKEVMSSQ